MRTFWPPLTKLVIFLIVTIAATYVLAVSIATQSPGTTYSYSADFSDVTGLNVGDDIRIAGVRVGVVSSIKLVQHNLAEVGFTVIKTRSLPTSSIARIRYRNLIGQRYIAIESGTGDPTKVLPAHGTIPLAQTQNALDLTALFAGFQPLFQGLDGTQVNELSGEIVQILQGEGGTVEILLSQLADLTNTIADKDAVIGDLINNLSSVLVSVNQRDQQLSDLIVNLQQWISGLSQDRNQIGQSIAGINALATSTAGLLVGIRPSLAQDVKDIGALSKNLNKPNNQKILQDTIQTLPGKIGGLIRTASYGSWFNFYLCNAGGTVTLPVVGTKSITAFNNTASRCQ